MNSQSDTRFDCRACYKRALHCRIKWGAITGTLFGAMIAAMLVPPPPLLLWNASASAPVGLWSVAPGRSPARGDMVVARLGEPWRGMAARRHYLPANVPLIKRVAAVPGDRVCAFGNTVWINGVVGATRQSVDGQGRKLPTWSGCILLGKDEVLLLMDAEASFDGRYFGPTRRRDIVGKAYPLCLR